MPQSTPDPFKDWPTMTPGRLYKSRFKTGWYIAFPTMFDAEVAASSFENPGKGGASLVSYISELEASAIARTWEEYFNMPRGSVGTAPFSVPILCLEASGDYIKCLFSDSCVGWMKVYTSYYLDDVTDDHSSRNP